MKILLHDFNNVLDDVSEELIRRGHEILAQDGQASTWRKADVIVVWQETEDGGWREWIQKVQKAGKRVVLVQHGRRGISRIYPPFNDPLVSDVVCVWGQNDVDRLVSVGVPREKIIVTGTPVVKHIKPRIAHTGINVVFSPEHWDRDVAENLIIASALRKMRNVKVITKILKGEHNPREYDNPVASSRLEPGHLDVCVDVLRTADVVVSMSESTFELMAQAMNIPVVIADIWIPKSQAGEERHKEYTRTFTNACEKVRDMSNISTVIMKHIHNPERLAKERKEISILDGGTDIEDPVSNIINVILNNE